MINNLLLFNKFQFLPATAILLLLLLLKTTLLRVRVQNGQHCFDILIMGSSQEKSIF